MRNRALTSVVLVALFAGTAAAQDPADVMMMGQVHAAPLPPPGVGFEIGMLAVEPLEMGDPVQNAPYSAEILTEVTHELADGNRIERKTTSTVARDNRGRTRREQQLAAIGPVLPDDDVRMITISDPVARVSYSLDSVRKIAIRSRPPGPMRPPGGRPADVVMFNHRIEPPEEHKARTEKLGMKEFEGVRAEGTRTVLTVPAGAIGNIRPIEVVNERWYSPELRVVVYSRRADPRFGETVYRLTNIIRAEPDPSLFQVPADYKKEDLKPLPFGPTTGAVVVRPPM
jgi:hypothetical protein